MLKFGKILDKFRRIFIYLLHKYFLITRGLTLGVRAIVRSADGKFLLVRHTYISGWHFPGGGVEKGGTVISALRKELLQEIGMNIVGAPVLLGIFFHNRVSGRDHVIVYICDVCEIASNKLWDLEIAEIGYFDLDDLPDDTDLGTVRRMQEVVNGALPSETW